MKTLIGCLCINLASLSITWVVESTAFAKDKTMTDKKYAIREIVHYIHKANPPIRKYYAA